MVRHYKSKQGAKPYKQKYNNDDMRKAIAEVSEGKKTPFTKLQKNIMFLKRPLDVT